jgi:TRAP-type transport system large permease protein
MTITVFLVSLIGAMALGVPIAFSLLLCGVALMWHLNMFDAQILAQNLIEGANSFPLLAVPFFMLAGEIMNAGGLSRRIVNFALASLLLPMMVAAGHDRARSAGLIASAGIIAPVIPPSIGFVIFGVAGNVSISKLFMAGIFPGIMLGMALWITWWWLARREVVEVPPRKTTGEIMVALREATWALVLPLIVVFGLKFGLFTPTEAAVVAAVYALLVSTFARAAGNRPPRKTRPTQATPTRTATSLPAPTAPCPCPPCG